MKDGRRALYAVAGIEIMLLLIVVIGGAIVVAFTDKLTWDEYLRDIMILAGALGIGGGIAAAGAAGHASGPTTYDPAPPATQQKEPPGV